MRLLINANSSLCVKLGGMSDFVSVERYIRIVYSEVGRVIGIHFPVEFDEVKKMWRYRGHAMVQFLNPHEAVAAANKDSPRPEPDFRDESTCSPGSFYNYRGKYLRVEEQPLQKEFDIQRLFELQQRIGAGERRWTAGMPRVSPTGNLQDLCYGAEGFSVPPAKWHKDCSWAI